MTLCPRWNYNTRAAHSNFLFPYTDENCLVPLERTVFDQKQCLSLSILFAFWCNLAALHRDESKWWCSVEGAQLWSVLLSTTLKQKTMPSNHFISHFFLVTLTCSLLTCAAFSESGFDRVRTCHHCARCKSLTPASRQKALQGRTCWLPWWPAGCRPGLALMPFNCDGK